MRLYLFRLTPDIPVEAMEKVAYIIGQVFNIDYTVFSQPILKSMEEVTIEDLLRISDQFLERGEPVTAIVFVRGSVMDDEDILGQGSEPHRAAWVRWNDDIHKTVKIALHELGHICDCEHCADESCLMFHTYRERNEQEFVLDKLFCDKCKAIIKGSWVYTRLISSAKHRLNQRRALPKVISYHTDTQASPQKPNSITPEPTRPSTYIPVHVSRIEGRPPFPSWDLVHSNPDEFLRQVMEHFGYKRSELSV